MKNIFFLIFCISSLFIKSQIIYLKGFWQGDDGTYYYVNHDGITNVWWYSESDTTPNKTISVAYGNIRNDTLYMKWSNVPTPNNDRTEHGSLVIYIYNSSKLSVISQTGGFPSTLLTRRKVKK